MINLELLAILKKHTKDKEWVEQNRYTNSVFEYILSGKNDDEKLSRVAGVLAAVQVLMINSDYLLIEMMTGVSKAKGIDLMTSPSELKDFRANRDRSN